MSHPQKKLPSSAELIRLHSQARYLVVSSRGDCEPVDSYSAFGRRLASDAREGLVRKYC